MNNPVADNHEIFEEIFDAGMNPEKMLQSLESAIGYDEMRDKMIGLVHSILTTLSSLAVDINDITSSEASFSFYVIWPFIHAVAKAINGVMSYPEKYYLVEAITNEFTRRRIKNNQHYKADGCVSVNINNVNHEELLLLEISGHFKLGN